jgi:hypothetical protein
MSVEREVQRHIEQSCAMFARAVADGRLEDAERFADLAFSVRDVAPGLLTPWRRADQEDA